MYVFVIPRLTLTWQHLYVTVCLSLTITHVCLKHYVKVFTKVCKQNITMLYLLTYWSMPSFQKNVNSTLELVTVCLTWRGLICHSNIRFVKLHRRLHSVFVTLHCTYKFNDRHILYTKFFAFYVAFIYAIVGIIREQSCFLALHLNPRRRIVYKKNLYFFLQALESITAIHRVSTTFLRIRIAAFERKHKEQYWCNYRSIYVNIDDKICKINLLFTCTQFIGAKFYKFLRYFTKTQKMK